MSTDDPPTVTSIGDVTVRVLVLLQVTLKLQVIVPAQYGKDSATVAETDAEPIVAPAVTVPPLYVAFDVVHPVGVAVVFHVGFHVWPDINDDGQFVNAGVVVQDVAGQSSAQMIARQPR